ncbi:FG-GAP repeat-containing protein [Alteromonadaceae bacterium Bs31]|nr:FG-GAP repeat-containing protein [Alteromonadaceae bacterium Bs31]
MKKLISLSFIIFIAILQQACSGDDDSTDAADTTPADFIIGSKSGLGLGIYVDSDPVTITGIDDTTDISIKGGEYSINGGGFTSSEGTISKGQNVVVRVASSENLYSTTEATLTVGGVERVFYVRTTSLVLSVRAGLKSLVFSWPEVNGALYYRLLYQKNAEAAFEQYGPEIDSATSSLRYEVATHRFDWYHAKFKLEACTTDGCFSTLAIDAVNHLNSVVAYFKAVNTEAFDGYGALALSGDGKTLAVAAPMEDALAINDGDYGSNNASGSGAVYVYNKVGMDWFFQAYLKAANAEAEDAFGSALALSGDGNTLAIGAPYEDGGEGGIGSDGSSNTLSGSGAVYLFKRVGDTWLQQSAIKAEVPSANANFGSAVALSTYGGTLAVGAPAEQGKGSVYTFVAQNENWLARQTLLAPNGENNDSFGSSLALSAAGDALLVGAPNENANSTGIDGAPLDANAPYAGAAYLFSKNDSEWMFSHYFKASNTAENNWFGTSLDISADGKTLVVGAPGESSSAIDVNGEQSNAGMAGAGAAYVFHNEGGWRQRAYLKSSNSDIGDNFGASVSINANGDVIAVGAPHEASMNSGVDSNDGDNSAPGAGAAYSFEFIDGQWKAAAYIKASNTDEGDLFAGTLSLDASGNTLAVGAIAEDGSDQGVDPINQASNAALDSGAVYLF